MRILVVDDDAANLDSLATVLALDGHQGICFEDPASALAAFEERRFEFDAAILDRGLPGMDGLELKRELRSLRPDLPVIMISGRYPAAPKIETRGEAVDVFMAKPLDAKAVLGQIARFGARV